MRISDWSSDVCSSDLRGLGRSRSYRRGTSVHVARSAGPAALRAHVGPVSAAALAAYAAGRPIDLGKTYAADQPKRAFAPERHRKTFGGRSAQHTSALQSLMRISYAVFCLKQKKPK